MSNPPWLTWAFTQMGVRETKGAQHTAMILEWWRAIKRGGIKDDETPWCAAFVGAAFEQGGIQSSRFESARSYEAWGDPLEGPAHGCVVVFRRDGGGHVGFVVGQDHEGRLLVLGGNQQDEVNVRAFDRARATAYRWPSGWQQPPHDLPILAGIQTSTRES